MDGSTDYCIRKKFKIIGLDLPSKTLIRVIGGGSLYKIIKPSRMIMNSPSEGEISLLGQGSEQVIILLIIRIDIDQPQCCIQSFLIFFILDIKDGQSIPIEL